MSALRAFKSRAEVLTKNLSAFPEASFIPMAFLGCKQPVKYQVWKVRTAKKQSLSHARTPFRKHGFPFGFGKGFILF